MAYEITSIGGNCPVQAEGMIGGLPFYFRARGEHWSFRVADKPDGDPVDGLGFYYEESYAEGEQFAAGWMEESEARTFIEKAAKLYEEKRKMPEMPLYVCHKEVRAAKIKSITHPMEQIGHTCFGFEGNVESRTVPTSSLDRKPEARIGHYFVDYGDYFSFSPAEKFEDGYTLKQ